MDLNIDLNILEVEPAEQYHAQVSEYLSSHQLLDFVKCPLLYRRKALGLIEDKDSPAYLLGRAAHVRILEGREWVEAAFALGGPTNPKTGKPYGAKTKAFAAWAQAQGKPVSQLLVPFNQAAERLFITFPDAHHQRRIRAHRLNSFYRLY